jgi:hypothetical protein
MPYVSRDEEGRIVALYAKSQEGATEEVKATSPEIFDFLARSGSDTADLSQAFLGHDLALIRVIEDLVQILITKEVISPYDLPKAALDKLSLRTSLRDGHSAFSLNQEDGVFSFPGSQ